MQIPVGWAVDRFNLRWLYSVMFLIWSLAQGLTGLATGLGMLIVFRMLLAVKQAGGARKGGEKGPGADYGTFCVPEVVCSGSRLESGRQTLSARVHRDQRWQWSGWQVGSVERKLRFCGAAL